MTLDAFVGATCTGKMRRLRRIFSPTSRRTIIVPLDDGLIFGPFQGLENLAGITAALKKSAANAVLAFKGTFRARAIDLQDLGWILNLTGSTIGPTHTHKVQIGSVEQALRLAVEAVAVHVNVTDAHEGDMLKSFGAVVRECERVELPVVAIMYPRRSRNGQDDNYESLLGANREEYSRLVAHACRIGVKLGADIVKTKYSGDRDSFRKVVGAASGTPVVIAGGPLVSRELAIQQAADAISAGAAGISFGRNVYQRKDLGDFLEEVSAVVHGDTASKQHRSAG